jgi:hypothetical protein
VGFFADACAEAAGEDYGFHRLAINKRTVNAEKIYNKLGSKRIRIDDISAAIALHITALKVSKCCAEV